MVIYLEGEENFFKMYSQWNAKRSKSFIVRRSSVYFFGILLYMIEILQVCILKMVWW